MLGGVLGIPSLCPLDAWSIPPNCNDQMFPGEQNLLVENQGPGAVQGPSLAPPLDAETEASKPGMANGADLAWPPRGHHTIPSPWKEGSLMAFQLEPKPPSQLPPR